MSKSSALNKEAKPFCPAFLRADAPAFTPGGTTKQSLVDAEEVRQDAESFNYYVDPYATPPSDDGHANYYNGMSTNNSPSEEGSFAKEASTSKTTTLRFTAKEFVPKFATRTESDMGMSDSSPSICNDSVVLAKEKTATPEAPKKIIFNLKSLYALEQQVTRAVPKTLPHHFEFFVHDYKPPIGVSCAAGGVSALPMNKEAGETLARLVLSTLNKLTPSKYSALLSELLGQFSTELRMSHEGMEHLLQKITPMIHQKALSETKFGAMYAELCRDICNRITLIDAGKTAFVDDEHAYNSAERFQMLLLERSQLVFKEPFVPPEDGENSAQDAMEKFRKRKFSNVSFIAELYVKELLPDAVIPLIMRKLLGRNKFNQPVERSREENDRELEAACLFLTVAGATLERKHKDLVDTYVATIHEHMAELKKTCKKMPRVAVLLGNVLDMRKKGWVARKTEEKHELQEIVASSPPKAVVDRDATQRTIYMTSIDTNLSETALMRILRSCGELLKVRLCGNPSHPTQYAFFEFRTVEACCKCLALDGSKLGATAVRCSISRNAIHDTLPHDAIIGENGLQRACTFGLKYGGVPASDQKLCASFAQTGDHTKQRDLLLEGVDCDALVRQGTALVDEFINSYTDKAVRDKETRKQLAQIIDAAAKDLKRGSPANVRIKLLVGLLLFTTEQKKREAQRVALVEMLTTVAIPSQSLTAEDLCCATKHYVRECVETEAWVDSPALWPSFASMLTALLDNSTINAALKPILPDALAAARDVEEAEAPLAPFLTLA